MILLGNYINYSCWIRSQDGKRLISEIDRVIYYFDSLIIINICTYMTRYVVFFFFFYYYFDNPSVAFCDKFSLFVRSRLISLPLAHSLARSCALSLSPSLSFFSFLEWNPLTWNFDRSFNKHRSRRMDALHTIVIQTSNNNSFIMEY